MKYRLLWPNSETVCQLVTSDEVITDATGNMEWCVGRTLYAVYVWCKPKNIRLYSVDDAGKETLIGDM